MATHYRRLLAAGLLCLVVMLTVTLSGCGSSAPTVAGTVSVGDVPLDEGSITFFPIDGTPGGTPGAKISQGKYEVSSGLTVGRYRIAIQGTRPDPVEMEYAPLSEELIPKHVQVVPEVYRGQDSPLIETVKRGHQNIPFDLPEISVNTRIR